MGKITKFGNSLAKSNIKHPQFEIPNGGLVVSLYDKHLLTKFSFFTEVKSVKDPPHQRYPHHPKQMEVILAIIVAIHQNRAIMYPKNDQFSTMILTMKLMSRTRIRRKCNLMDHGAKLVVKNSQFFSR